jgi:hypothetical protein
VLEKNKKARMSFDLCLHDGALYKDDVSKSIRAALNIATGAQDQIKKVVHVTSLAFRLSTGGQRLDAEGPIVRLSVDSWHLQDYHDAINCQAFIDAGKIKENLQADQDTLLPAGAGPDTPLADLIDAKYYYAGGCARFMFEYELSGLIELLNDICRGLSDGQWQYFAMGSVSTQTPDGVNTLMQQFGGHATPVSKYILFRAYKVCKTKLVAAVKTVASEINNPALKGWAFELAQIDLICLSLVSSIPQYVTNKKGWSFYPRSSIEFDEKKLLLPGQVVNGTIIWCLEWNQGCFDVAYYDSRTLFTIQFTVSKKHDLKPIFIRKLRDALAEKGVTVDNCIHVAVGGAEDFQFEVKEESTGQQLCNDKKPIFTINVYWSPPLVMTDQQPNTFEFQDAHASNVINMWALGSAKRKKC